MKNEAKVIEKEKVKLFVVLVLVLLGAGVAFEFERASKPQAEVVVVFYDDGSGRVKKDEPAVETFEAKPDVVEEQKATVATDQEGDVFFEYLRDVDEKVNAIVRHTAVLDKIESLKVPEEKVLQSEAFEKAKIEVYNNEGEVAKVIEDKVDEAAEEIAVLEAVSGEADVAEEVAEESKASGGEEELKENVLLKETSDSKIESPETSEYIENIEENLEHNEAIDMMKEIIERDKKENAGK